MSSSGFFSFLAAGCLVGFLIPLPSPCINTTAVPPEGSGSLEVFTYHHSISLSALSRSHFHPTSSLWSQPSNTLYCRPGAWLSLQHFFILSKSLLHFQCLLALLDRAHKGRHASLHELFKQSLFPWQPPFPLTFFMAAEHL